MRGDSIASLNGSARSIEGFFGVQLTRYRTPAGREFFAGNREAVLRPALRKIVDGVAGLDDFAQLSVAAIRPGGLTPDDVSRFYNIAALRAKGLDGSGETVVFPELNSPGDVPKLREDLAYYAAKFHLPPFDLTVRSSSAWHPLATGDSYGESALSEAALDLEIVHAIAPKAKLVIYTEGRGYIDGLGAEMAMVREHPTAVISDSIGGCELGIPSASALEVVEAPWARQAQEKMTHFAASGDSGAYDCGQNHQAAVDFPSDLPSTTAVGGTTVFQTTTGAYGREVAWGDPLAQAGGGGKIAGLYTARLPARPGDPQPAKHGSCPTSRRSRTGTPARVHPPYGGRRQIGGTSAAAPLWAESVAALIDQDLVAGLPTSHRPRRSPGALLDRPAQATYHAFHDVTIGNNLLYVAGRGWDNATGWGTPDAARWTPAWKAPTSARAENRRFRLLAGPAELAQRVVDVDADHRAVAPGRSRRKRSQRPSYPPASRR